MRLDVCLPAVLGLALAGCTITQDVQPVKAGAVDSVCIERNSGVLMEGFLPELESLIAERGIETMVYEGDPPASCQTLVKYSANWRWDMAMYLHYAKIEVFEGRRVLGSAEYDARSGGANFGKFGSTREKIAPLVAQLFP